MNKQSHPIVDSFSASELLNALSTLTNMTNTHPEYQISFCNQQHDIKPSQFIHHHQNNEKKSPVKSIQKSTQRSKVWPSPLRQFNRNVPKSSCNMQSRSHSPFEKTTQRTVSRVSHFSKVQRHNQTKVSTNKRQLLNTTINATKKQPVCPSFNSQRIMAKKEKNGVAYVPIQLRAEELLRQKEKKLAKMKKQTQFCKVLEQKECTFRPQTTPYIKTPKALRNQQSHRISQLQKQRFEQCFIDQECMSTQPSRDGGLVKEVGNVGIVRGYKNARFNCLLDLIGG